MSIAALLMGSTSDPDQEANWRRDISERFASISTNIEATSVVDELTERWFIETATAKIPLDLSADLRLLIDTVEILIRNADEDRTRFLSLTLSSAALHPDLPSMGDIRHAITPSQRVNPTYNTELRRHLYFFIRSRARSNANWVRTAEISDGLWGGALPAVLVDTMLKSRLRVLGKGNPSALVPVVRRRKVDRWRERLRRLPRQYVLESTLPNPEASEILTRAEIQRLAADDIWLEEAKASLIASAMTGMHTQDGQERLLRNFAEKMSRGGPFDAMLWLNDWRARYGVSPESYRKAQEMVRP